MQRTSKRTVSLTGSALAVLGYALFYLAGGAVPALFATLALLGVAAGAAYLTFWAMLPDTVEYGEWRTGVRAEGIIFGFISFVQKAALGIAVGLLGEVLTAIGYVANRSQAPEPLADMRLVMLWVPILCALAAAAARRKRGRRWSRKSSPVCTPTRRRPRRANPPMHWQTAFWCSPKPRFPTAPSAPRISSPSCSAPISPAPPAASPCPNRQPMSSRRSWAPTSMSSSRC
jgi:MFS family permease